MNWQPIRVFPGTFGIPTAKLTREQWAAYRDKAGEHGIGGSEIGLLLPGADLRFNSPIRMYYQRIGLWPSNYQDSKYAFMGRLLEQQVIHLWRHWAGSWKETMENVDAGRLTRKSAHCNYIIKNPEFPYLFANIDNRIINSPDAPKRKGILECKTMSGHASDRYETGIPPKYIAQMQHYMLVTGQEYAELAVLKDGVDFEVYPLFASEIIQNAIVSAAEAFFDCVIQAKAELKKLPRTATMNDRLQIAQAFEPVVQNGDDEYDFLSEKAKLRLSQQAVDMPDEVLEWYLTYNNYKDTYDAAAEQMQGIKNKVRQKMISDDVYQYRVDNRAAITNGKRFIIK